MGGTGMKDVGGAVLAGSSLPFLGRPSHFRSKFSFFFSDLKLLGFVEKSGKCRRKMMPSWSLQLTKVARSWR